MCTHTDLPPDDKSSLEAQLKVREDQLAPIYHQVAVAFADLHDTPGRMQEKGVVAVSIVVNSINPTSTLITNSSPSLPSSLHLSLSLSSLPPSLSLSLSPSLPFSLCRMYWSGEHQGNSSTGDCEGDCVKSVWSRWSWKLTSKHNCLHIITHCKLHVVLYDRTVYNYSTLSRGEATEVLKRWFVESKGTVNVSKSS